MWEPGNRSGQARNVNQRKTPKSEKGKAELKQLKPQLSPGPEVSCCCCGYGLILRSHRDQSLTSSGDLPLLCNRWVSEHS